DRPRFPLLLAGGVRERLRTPPSACWPAASFLMRGLRRGPSDLAAMRSLPVRGRCFAPGWLFCDTSPLRGRWSFTTVARELPKPVCHFTATHERTVASYSALGSRRTLMSDDCEASLFQAGLLNPQIAEPRRSAPS